MKCPYHIGSTHDGYERCRLRTIDVMLFNERQMCLSTENNDKVYVEKLGYSVHEAWKHCHEYFMAKSGTHPALFGY